MEILVDDSVPADYTTGAQGCWVAMRPEAFICRIMAKIRRNYAHPPTARRQRPLETALPRACGRLDSDCACEPHKRASCHQFIRQVPALCLGRSLRHVAAAHRLASWTPARGDFGRWSLHL